MRIHPLLDDPNAVLIYRVPVEEPVGTETYHRAAYRILEAMQVELEGEKAVIKPNVTSGERFADPHSGITTHPAFIGGLIDCLLERGACRDRIYILEDPRNSDDDRPRHWQGTGFETLAQATGARLRCPTSYTCVKLAVPQPQAQDILKVSRLAVGPNTVLLNVPKMKTHNLGITTLCLKNLMGVVNVSDRHFCAQAWQEMPQAVRDDKRPRHEWMDRSLHERWQGGLARRLCDTAQVVKPHLNIVEGVVAREGTGFQRGRNRALGLVVAGVNMVAVDSVTSYLMGFEPRELIYLRMAAEVGLGNNDLACLRLYTVRDEAIADGSIELCRDVEALRARPALQVLSGIAGEDDRLFT